LNEYQYTGKPGLQLQTGFFIGADPDPGKQVIGILEQHLIKTDFFHILRPNKKIMTSDQAPGTLPQGEGSFKRSLSLLDGILLVVGSMIGSGIFITSSEIARTVGSPGWLLVVWILSGIITMIAAISYGELSGMFPKAGGQYVYLREAYNKRIAFLFGWSFFAVIQTGTIAAVAVAFAKFTGYLIPQLGEDNILLTVGDSFKITAAQVLAIASILFLSALNAGGVKNAKWIQFIFTFAKIAALAALIIMGFWVAKDMDIWSQNMDMAWMAKSVNVDKATGTITSESLSGLTLICALGVAMVGALFSSDAWNGVTFIAGEIKKPEKNIGLSLFIGTLIVTVIYVACNFMYLAILTTNQVGRAPADRVAVAAAEVIWSGNGAKVIAIMIMVSTFGCNNGLIMAGARVYYQMAKDRLFLPAAQHLNKNGVPAKALWMQAIWASLLCLSGKYGDLLNFIIFTVLLFYILTIAGIFILRKKMPDAPRPYKAFGYPFLPALYIILASVICIILLYKQTQYAGSGLLIVLIGLPVYAYFNRKERQQS
jgi:APA family basic amino acid/polyamine antiporter